MKKKVLNKYAKRRRIAILAVVLVIALIIVLLNIFKVEAHKKPDKISLMLNNEIVELEKEMYKEEENIYISKEDIVKLFDDTLYYNEAEKELITTYNTHIALLKVDETFMVLNDSNVELKGCLTEKDGVIYLPLTDLGIVYDLEIEYSEEYNRVILSSTQEEKKQAITLKKATLKEKPSMFSKKIEKLDMSEYVVVLGTEKKYKKVRTENGNIGYVKENKISNEETIREKMVNPVLDVNIVEDASDILKQHDNSLFSTEKQNVVIPTFFTLDKDQKVLDKTNSSTNSFASYTNWIRENNVQIWATITNSANISENLLTYTQRNSVINSIYNYLIQYQFQGINIDFDKIDDINSFNRFLIELKPNQEFEAEYSVELKTKLKESGLKLCITYNNSLDKNKIQNIADWIIEK